MTYKTFWSEELETLPLRDLETLQRDRLALHLELAYAKSPYYRAAFDAAHVKPRDLRTLADLRKFPFTNKQVERERQAIAPLLGDMTTVTEEDVVFVSSSSGSTGVPTISPFTAEDFDEWQDVEARLFWMAGIRPTDRYVHAMNFTLFVGGPDVIGAQRLGALCIWAGAIPSDRLLFIMKTFRPTVTWTTPSYAWHLGETAKAAGIDPARDLAIRRIIVAGEPGGSIGGTRAAIEALWGAELFDFYGISDIYGACAGHCSRHEGLHLVEDQILLEVLDPATGEPVEPGAQGEMVLTTLRKRARPMIRFRTGDIITADRSPCGCGRTHARISVIGRLDDMFIVSGVNVFPSDIEQVIRQIPKLTGEYQIRLYEEQHLTRFDLEVEAESSAVHDEALVHAISEAVKARLGLRPKRVTVFPLGTLPRTTHKAKRVLDERKAS